MQPQSYLLIGLQKIIGGLIKCLLVMESFNHESPRRGETFVTRKITIGLAKLSMD